MEFPKLRTTEFEFEEYGEGEGFKVPPHRALRGYNCFKLSVENCRITDVRLLYRIIADQLKIEAERIERIQNEAVEDVHPLQYGVVEFMENILAEMKKVEGIDDLDYYVIKTR